MLLGTVFAVNVLPLRLKNPRPDPAIAKWLADHDTATTVAEESVGCTPSGAMANAFVLRLLTVRKRDAPLPVAM
jgi:hypothetical protein